MWSSGWGTHLWCETRIEITFDQVHPGANGYLTLLRTGEGLGGEGRGDGHYHSHAVHSDTMWNPNIHCPYGQLAMGLTFTFNFFVMSEKMYLPPSGLGFYTKGHTV